MLRKLKIKFVLTNLILITIVLAVFFVSLYINAKRNIEQESMNALSSFVSISEKDVEKQGSLHKPSENIFDNPGKDEVNINEKSHLSVFCVKTDSSGNLVSVYNYSYTLTGENKALLQGYVRSAISTGAESGILEEENLRFYITRSMRNTYVSFLEMEYEQEAILNFIEGFYIIFGISWMLVLIVSIILANIAIRPVEKAWIRQKQFVADASHELKTPLTVIISSTDIMMSDTSDVKPEHRKWLECTKNESERMKELLSGMLYLARSEDENDGAKSASRSVVDFSEILTESLLNFEIQCYEKGKTLNQDIDEGIFIKGDVSELKQLIGIFLDNACKYSDENGEITVSLKSLGGKCQLSFKNTGEPIPKQDIPHLFERFYRSSASRSRKEGGYGLGLSIAQTIATNHGSKISVVSDSSGTVFSLKFARESEMNK